MAFEPGDSVKVAGYSGVAWRVIGPHTENQWVECLVYDESTDDDGTLLNDDVYDIGDWEEVETGMIDVHMVGDDRTFTFDPDELTPLTDAEFCHDCGQTSCKWNVYN